MTKQKEQISTRAEQEVNPEIEQPVDYRGLLDTALENIQIALKKGYNQDFIRIWIAESQKLIQYWSTIAGMEQAEEAVGVHNQDHATNEYTEFAQLSRVINRGVPNVYSDQVKTADGAMSISSIFYDPHIPIAFQSYSIYFLYGRINHWEVRSKKFPNDSRLPQTSITTVSGMNFSDFNRDYQQESK